MKRQLALLSIVTLFASLTFTACKKEASTDTTSNTEVSKHSEDQSRFSTEIDAVANDANVAVESNGSFTGRTDQVQSIICNANVIIDTMTNPRTITIVYNGLNCQGTATRTGTVVLSMAQGVHWKDAGAVINVHFQDLHIVRVSDNKSITINGSKTLTNVSGGLLYQLATLGTITHTLTSTGLSITFDDGSQRVWQMAQQRVFTYQNGVVITTTGMHSDGTYTNIAEWGLNRFGHPFVSATTAPMVIRQDCDFRLTSGQITHHTIGLTSVATFGLDANGSPTGCPGTGHYYCKIVWTGSNGNSYTVIFPY